MRTWDPAKASSNLKKHGVHFDAAIHVFDDPRALTILDRVEDGEHRWQTIGMIEGSLLVLVAHTEDDDGEDEIVRIISARRATRQERRAYEEATG
jgi:hypothetical protein